MTNTLNSFLPKGADDFIHQLLAGHLCHIKTTKDRKSKLGDYRLLPNKSHIITINGNLEPFLFFFVLTHEIAHLLAFKEKTNISPHGKEWKKKFQKLLLESLEIYPSDLRDLIVIFAKNPKANFMSSPELVKYFNKGNPDNQIYIEDLILGDQFIYQSYSYQVEETKKKTIPLQKYAQWKKILV